MSIRDELADILEALDGSDYMDVADTILARFAVVEPPNGAKHAEAIADTGDGYVSLGRGHLLQCLWCDEHFFGWTKTEAEAKYRVHERAMLAAAKRAEARS